MKEYKVTMTWMVDDSISETELERLERHIDSLINLAEWPEIEGVSCGIRIEKNVVRI